MSLTLQVLDMQRDPGDGFVLLVLWRASVSRDDAQISADFSTQFDRIEGESFVPYDELTEPVVLGWITERAGEERLTTIQADLENALALQLDPPPEPLSGLPWVS
jgi:hypothetical protein